RLPSLRHRHRQKARLEYPPNPHRKAKHLDPNPRQITNGLGVTEKYANSGQAIEKYEFHIWILLRLIWKSLRLIWKSLRLAWILSAPIWNSDRRGRPPVME
ncbi:MAG: hypothetical protein WB715_19935, partial [Roseiarcus sp.]|uniref:hypothetical protein n=1 Tax=Roseiarcus sp. TaxID=1969460 RepID=UPI003C6658B3